MGNFLTASSTGATTDNTGNMNFTHVTRNPEQRLFNLVGGGRTDFGKNFLTYEMSLGQARFTGGFPRASFVPISGASPINNVAFGIDTTNPHTPKFNVLNGVNIFDPTQYALDQLTFGGAHTFERDVIGSLSFNHQYKIGSHFGSLEIGGRGRDARKSELSNQTTMNGDDSLAMSSMLGNFTNSHYYFGVYPFGPTTDYKKILAAFKANPGLFTPDPNTDLRRNVPADFDTTERVYAGYIMNTINFGRLRLQTGVRIEATSASFLGNRLVLPTAGSPVITPVTGSQDYVDALPSVQMQYAFDSNTILRAAYGMGIARPNFGDLPPFVLEQDKRKTISAGNPNLIPEHAQNFDLLLEHYFGRSAGVIQGGVFYKYLTDPIFRVNTALTSGTFAGFTQTQPINGSNGHITGVEMAWQQHLTFLPGLLNGMGVRANYSYTSSQATFPANFGRTDKPALLRTAPNNWNFDVTYDKKGVSARMGLTHNDANIFSYNFADKNAGGIKGPNGDQYLYPHTQVDAQVSYWIPKARGFQFIVSLLNLNNEVFGFYQGSEQFPVQREYYNPTYSFGLRWTLGREH